MASARQLGKGPRILPACVVALSLTCGARPLLRQPQPSTRQPQPSTEELGCVAHSASMALAIDRTTLMELKSPDRELAERLRVAHHAAMSRLLNGMGTLKPRA